MRSRCALGSVGALALGSALGGCGSPPPPDTVVVDNSIHVTIHAGGQRDAGPPAIDLDDPRVAVAEGKIAAMLGHPLAMEFDAALAKSFADDLHRAYVSALESTASGLADCQRTEPDVFAFGAGRVRVLRLAYSPLGPGERSDAAPIDGVLPIGVRTGSSRLLDGYELCLSFRRSLREDRARRFAELDPTQVPREDEAGYLEYIRQRPYGRRSVQEERLDYLRRGAKMAAFRLHVESPKVGKDADELLANFASTLHDAVASQPGDAVMVTALNAAHRAWIDWVNQAGTALDDSDRLDVAIRLFWRFDPVHAQFRAGFDAPRFGLPSIERWLQDTAPEKPREGKDALEKCIVNPPERGDVPPRLWMSGSCNGAVYSDLASTPQGRRRLVGLLARWRSDVLVEAAVLHTLRDRGSEATLALLDALASDPEAWRVALRAIAEFGEWSNKRRGDDDVLLAAEPFVARVPAWWQSQPERRGTLLYLLVRVGEHREGAIPWAKLSQFLGRPITAAELAAFFAEDARNVWYLPALAAGLGSGWSRASAFVPGVEAYLDAEARNEIAHGIGRMLERVIPVLCEAGSRQEVVELQHTLERRAELYPSQRRELGPTIHSKPGELCPRLGQRTAARREASTPFGD